MHTMQDQAETKTCSFVQNNEYEREEYFRSQLKQLLSKAVYKKTPENHTGPLLKSEKEIGRLKNFKKTEESILSKIKEKQHKIRARMAKHKKTENNAIKPVQQDTRRSKRRSKIKQTIDRSSHGKKK